MKIKDITPHVKMAIDPEDENREDMGLNMPLKKKQPVQQGTPPPNFIHELDPWQAEPSKYINEPVKMPGQKITPHLYLTPALEEALKKVDGIGINITTLERAVEVFGLFEDQSFVTALSDMSPEEYDKTYKVIIKGTAPHDHQAVLISDIFPHVKMAIGPQEKYDDNQVADLVSVLIDVGFDMMNEVKARHVLSLVAESNSPWADVAEWAAAASRADIGAGLPPGWWQSILNTAAGIQIEETQETLDPGYNPVIEKTTFPGEVMTPEEVAKQYAEGVEDSPKKKSKPPLPVQAPQQEGAPPAQQIPAMPMKNLQTMHDRFEELKQALPAEYKSILKGSELPVRILPPDRPQGWEGAPLEAKQETQRAKIRTGQILRSYKYKTSAIVMGNSGDKVAVFTFPEGIFQLWDPIEDELRFSSQQPKQSDY